MNINKIMLFLLCFILVFNFCLQPYTVEAVPTIIGGKLLTFLLAMAAAGVTLSVAGKTDSQLATEANFLLDQFETANGQIQFWQDSLLCYLMNKGYQGVNAFTSLLDNVKDWIVGLGSVAGSNFLLDLVVTKGYINGYAYDIFMEYDHPSPFSFKYSFKISVNDSNPVGLHTFWGAFGDEYSVVSFDVLDTFYVDENTVRFVYDLCVKRCTLEGQISYFDLLDKEVLVVCDHYLYPDNPYLEETIEYNVNPFSYSLTGIPPNYYHKPNVLPPPVPTTTWDMTTGRSITTWPGTAEDFADGFADTVTWDDYRDVVAGVPSVPYSFDETVPGTLTIDYDYDYEDEGAGAIPVPYPDAYEGDVPSEGLLQGITNWITSLINTILGIPAKLIALLKELLITLFVPEPDFVQNKMDNINSKIGDKIGDNDYMNFLDSLKSLQGEPLPDGYLYGNKVFDASYINNMADTVKLWQRWFWYILIVLWYMNNVYKMIRGSNMVDFKAYDGVKDGGSSGGAKR